MRIVVLDISSDKNTYKEYACLVFEGNMIPFSVENLNHGQQPNRTQHNNNHRCTERRHYFVSSLHLKSKHFHNQMDPPLENSSHMSEIATKKVTGCIQSDETKDFGTFGGEPNRRRKSTDISATDPLHCEKDAPTSTRNTKIQKTTLNWQSHKRMKKVQQPSSTIFQLTNKIIDIVIN